MQNEEMIDIEVTLDKETADYVFGLNKNELRNALCVQVLRGRVQDEAIEKYEQQLANLQEVVEHQRAMLRQGRAMMNAVTEAWLS